MKNKTIFSIALTTFLVFASPLYCSSPNKVLSTAILAVSALSQSPRDEEEEKGSMSNSNDDVCLQDALDAHIKKYGLSLDNFTPRHEIKSRKVKILNGNVADIYTDVHFNLNSHGKITISFRIRDKSETYNNVNSFRFSIQDSSKWERDIVSRVLNIKTYKGYSVIKQICFHINKGLYDDAEYCTFSHDVNGEHKESYRGALHSPR